MTLEAFEERMHKLTSRNLSAEAEVIFQQASGDNTDDPRRKVSEHALYPEIFDQLWANLIGRSFITTVLGFVITRHAGRDWGTRFVSLFENALEVPSLRRLGPGGRVTSGT